MSRAYLVLPFAAFLTLLGCGNSVETSPRSTGGAGGATSTSTSSGSGGATTSTSSTTGSSSGAVCQNDFDCPSPPGTCQIPVCVGGLCTMKPAPVTAPCNGGCHCDGMGACAGPGCVSDDICFSPNACAIGKCVGCEECTVEYVPAGVPVPGNAPGDCKVMICDGMGQIVVVTDDSDTPEDGDPCTVGACVNGSPMQEPLCKLGETCNQGMCLP